MKVFRPVFDFYVYYNNLILHVLQNFNYMKLQMFKTKSKIKNVRMELKTYNKK